MYNLWRLNAIALSHARRWATTEDKHSTDHVEKFNEWCNGRGENTTNSEMESSPSVLPWTEILFLAAQRWCVLRRRGQDGRLDQTHLQREDKNTQIILNGRRPTGRFTFPPNSLAACLWQETMLRWRRRRADPAHR